MMASMPRTTSSTTAQAGTEHLYAVLQAHDARFDGRLFVGVTSTGIYCRPVCRVRVPLQRHCRFYANAALAEAAGFRPCLRCRPELAPGLSLMDSSSALAQNAAQMIDQAVHEGQDLYLGTTAAKLGVTDRHLRRIFQRAHGVTALQYLNTRRLLLAKQLLTDTPLPVTQVAHASGFASLRRFNAAFVQAYRLNPSALRKAAPAAALKDDALHLRLGYRPPYDVAGVLRFYADRAVPGVEAVVGDEVQRTLSCVHQGRELHGWLAARFMPQRNELHVRLAPVLAPALGTLLPRLRQAFDLDADPQRIDPAMLALPVPPRPGLRLTGGVDGFEMAVRVILGQQVTVAAARTLTRRLVDALGLPVETPFAGLHRLFPSAAAIANTSAETIGKLGIVRQRVGALQGLAAAVQAGQIELHRNAPLQATMQALGALPGIGEWTVQLVAMRALAWPDAFPATDIGLLNALGTRDSAAVLAQAEAWRPWRAYAVMRLWQTLETQP